MGKPPYTVRRLHQPDELAAYYQLRYKRLRQPWDQPATSPDAEGEAASVHLGAFDADRLIGTARLLSIDTTTMQLRSMAVAQSHQRRGVGSAILNFAENFAHAQGIHILMMHARENAVPFYACNGYVVLGESYTLFGVIPHFKMQKRAW